MKSNLLKFFEVNLVIWVLFTLSFSGFSQKKTSLKNQSGKTEAKIKLSDPCQGYQIAADSTTQSFRNIRTNEYVKELDEKMKKEKRNVSVFLLVNNGPVGKVYIPFDFDKKLEIRENVEKYFYPSFYFDVSTSPLYIKEMENNESNTITEIKNRDQDLEWFNVTIELKAWCVNDQNKLDMCKNDNYPLGILEILPNESRSGTKTSTPANIANIVSQLSGLTEPFFPSSSFDLKVASATKGLSVLFENLFPPKVVSYQMAHIDGLRSFGWTFRRDRAGENPSILGLHRGIVLLQAIKDVKAVSVSYEILSKWKKDISEDKKDFDIMERKVCMLLPQPEPNEIEYEKLFTLEKLPVVLTENQVRRILQMENGTAIPNEIKPITISDKEKRYLRSALEEYLGMKKKGDSEK